MDLDKNCNLELVLSRWVLLAGSHGPREITASLEHDRGAFNLP